MSYPTGSYPMQKNPGGPPPANAYPNQGGPPPVNAYPANYGYYPAQPTPEGRPIGATPHPHQQGYGQAPPPYTPYAAPNPGYPSQHTVTYIQQQPMQVGAYDPGARFSVGSTHNVPPPPPGVMPNSAQMAASQGQPVALTQRSADWVAGGPGAGYTFW